jgi:uncharacterized protein (TIGR02001 family)
MSHVPTLVTLALVALPAPAAAQSDSAAGSGLGVYAETRLVSRYVWRGYDLSQGSRAIQPYVELSLPFGLTANAFATSALDSHRDVDETQLSLGYKADLGGGFELGAGYVLYHMPGTETEPGADPMDPLAASSSGELFIGLTRSWEGGFATLTYSRGDRSGKGNSLNLWAQHDLTWLDERVTAQPYFQIDYLDEYGPPARFADRLSMLEVGVPVLVRVGPVQLLAAAHVSFVPSAYVREANAAAGATSNVALPWFSLGVVFDR